MIGIAENMSQPSTMDSRTRFGLFGTGRSAHPCRCIRNSGVPDSFWFAMGVEGQAQNSEEISIGKLQGYRENRLYISLPLHIVNDLTRPALCCSFNASLFQTSQRSWTGSEASHNCITISLCPRVSQQARFSASTIRSELVSSQAVDSQSLSLSPVHNKASCAYFLVMGWLISGSVRDLGIELNKVLCVALAWKREPIGPNRRK